MNTKISPTPELQSSMTECLLASEYLSSELAFIAKLADPKKPNEFRFTTRIAVRQYMSYVESVCNQFRAIIMSLDEEIIFDHLTEKEVLTLQEKRRNSKTGKIKTAFLPTKDMIKFTFKSFSKIFSPDYVLATGTNGWDKLVDSIEVRNRLTHPKNISGFDVTRDEFSNAKNAASWFQEQSIALVNQAFTD